MMTDKTEGSARSMLSEPSQKVYGEVESVKFP
jgi:hypothetical protein